MRRIVLLGILFVVACTGVTAPRLTRGINITNTAPANGVFPGDTFHIVATPLDAAGDPVPIDTVAYSSSNTSVATVTSTGLVTAIAAGSANIVAATDGQNAHVPLKVDGNVTGTILVTPPASTMNMSTQQQLTANVFTTLVNPARNKTVTWSTSDAGKATVDGSGNVSAIAATASVSICATATDAPSVKGCATVKIQ
jgi:uncharacterized protein YjdB